MKNDYLSIEQAAAQFGVSPATIRRRIKKGDLQAVKKMGPYGEQYYIPSSEVTTAQEITEVVPVEKKLNVQELAGFISMAIQKENEELHREIRELRQELTDLKKYQEERGQQRDQEIMTQIRNIMNEKKEPWFVRLFRAK